MTERRPDDQAQPAPGTERPPQPEPHTATSGRRPPGRPPTSGHHAFAARERRTGRVLSWADGQWAGDLDYVILAHAFARRGGVLPVTPDGPQVQVTPDDPVAALAIMQAVCGGNIELSGAVPELGSLPADERFS